MTPRITQEPGGPLLDSLLAGFHNRLEAAATHGAAVASRGIENVEMQHLRLR